MTKKQLSKIFEEWSDEFHKDYMDSYNHDFRSGHYRDLLDEFISRIDALNVATKKRWWQRSPKLGQRMKSFQ